MKKILVLALCFVFMFTAASFAEVWKGDVDGETWTAKSHINPFEFEKWKQIRVEPCRSGQPHFHSLIENHDPNHPVKKVDLLLLPLEGNIVVMRGYAYEYEGFTWYWKVNPEGKEYKFVQKIPLSGLKPPPTRTPPVAPKNPKAIPAPETNSDGMS